MPDPDHDTQSERRPDPRFDNWPVERPGGATDQAGETATPRDEGGTRERLADANEDEDLEWLGVAGTGAQGGTPFVYDRSDPGVYEGEFDDEESRVVVRETADRDVESHESLGEHIEDIGEEHGWSWLSGFAREYLEGDRHEELTDDHELEHTDSAFQQRQLRDSSSADVGFSGSHTFTDAWDRVHVIDRRFTVFDGESDAVRVDVDEYYLIAEEPREQERAGDADPIEEREYTIEREVDPNTPNWESAVEADLQEWHAAHDRWHEVE